MDDSKFNWVRSTLNFKDSSLRNVDFSHSKIAFATFDNVDLRKSNFDDTTFHDSKFINSNLNGLVMSIVNAHRVSFGNSDIGDLKMIDSKINSIIFDENSNLSDYLRYQIFWATSIEPITDNLDYVKRVIDNQLIKRFGIIDNPFTEFY